MNVFVSRNCDFFFIQFDEEIFSPPLWMLFLSFVKLSRKSKYLLLINRHIISQISNKTQHPPYILKVSIPLLSTLLSPQFFPYISPVPSYIPLHQHKQYYLFQPPMHNLLLLSLLISLSLAIFIPERLSIIDHNQKLNNYLVRGNLPMSQDNKFQITELKRNLSNLTGLDRYQLVVISFLNFLTAKQTKNRYIQEKYFDQNPTEGEYQQKLILGSLIDPFQYAEPVSKILATLSYLFDIDNIDGFITQLYSKIHKKGKNTIVFIHCSAGMDRTGYVAGAYKIKYLDYSLKEVVKENSKFGGARKFMHFNALNGLKWFCFSHKEREQCIVE